VNVGIIGTGAIANLHARVYRRIGFKIAVCTDVVAEAARRFAADNGCEVVTSYEDVCRHRDVDYVDVCTLPNFRLEAVEASAAAGKHVQVQKPMATSLETARRMIEIAARAGILLGVVSQHRFDESSRFLKSAIAAGRLGLPLQFDAYVKWYRSADYYARPVKGSWDAEGGGALINQAIHQVDLLRWFGGAVSEVFGFWQLGAAHRIESEDVLTAVLRFESGATGTIEASTAFWPGYPERIEIHGTKGTAVVTGDRLTTWDVQDDVGDPAPVSRDVASGASDPMAISLEPFEQQFLDFADAIRTARSPLISGEEGYQALQLVDAIYRSCRTGARVGVR
jgi:UDP-N-acetyl-2-amino-2-deoxyglucuronate dehydrogenase